MNLNNLGSLFAILENDFLLLVDMQKQEDRDYLKDYYADKQREYQKCSIYRERERKRREVYRREIGYGGLRTHLQELLTIYDWHCGICGQRIWKGIALHRIHVDHIIPRSKGGTDDLENLQPAHDRCNLRKGPRLTEATLDNFRRERALERLREKAALDN